MKQLTLTLITELTDATITAVKAIKDELEESWQNLENKEAGLETNKLLLEDADWRELYEYEKGYFVALEFCLRQLSQ